MRHNPVIVEWKDITSMGDWNEAPEDLDAAVIRTLGFLVSRDDEKLVIAGSYTPEDDVYYDHTVMPIGCVSRITELSDMPGVWEPHRKSTL